MSTTIGELIKRCDNDPVLLGAIQELDQLRDNPFAKLKPCAKYVRENNMGDQLKKLKLEIIEFENAKVFEDRVKEWFDIVQVGVTGMGILQKKYGQSIAEIIKDGQEKNSVRGYDYCEDSRD